MNRKMAPPPSTVVSPVVALRMRVLTFIFLMMSLIILTTNTATLYINLSANSSVNAYDVKLRFKDVHAYHYMLAAIVIGIAYTLLQTAFAIFRVSMGKRLGGDGLYQFDFYGDKVMSYILATGAATGFSATIGLKPVFSDQFYNKASAASSLLFLGFLFTAISSVFSSLALPKRD